MQKVLFIWKPTVIYPCIDNKKCTLKKNKVSKLTSIWANSIYVKANPKEADYCIRNALDSSIVEIKGVSKRFLAIMNDDVDRNLLSSFDHTAVVADQKQLYEHVNTLIPQVDSVVLLFPDTLGQGFEGIEKFITNKKPVFVLNGRKRFFKLDRKTYFNLRCRRIVEKYCLLESLTSLIFLVLIWPYYLFELATRNKSKGIFRKEPLKRLSESLNANEEENNIIQSIAEYWSSRPQTYGKEDGKAIYEDESKTASAIELGSIDFFEKLDKTFYSWNKSLHCDENGAFIPFANIFNYDAYKGKPVLEVGCGMGTMAMNWAKQGALIHAVDLSAESIKQTKERFRLNKLDGLVKQADARKLPFEDNCFNYAYSWGVLHHSPAIEHSIAEIYRVLLPGAKVGIMLYNRNSFLFRYFIQYNEGFLHYESKFLNLLELASRYGDGYMEEGNPYTYPVTKKEVLNNIMPQYKNIKIKIFGTDIPWMLSYLCKPYSGKIPLFLIKSIARRFGWSLWIEAEK